MSNEVCGKVIVITGASSGFGKGAARRFAQQGACVVLAARREYLLDDLARECEALGGRALAVRTDVSESEDVERLASAAISRFNCIDVWINDAGVGALGRFDHVPLVDHAQVIATDLLGTVYGSYVALRQFHNQQSGILINIASALGKIPAPYYASYTAAKYGIVGLCGALRQELRENNVDYIHICTVMPMAMDTPFFEHVSNYTGHEATPIPPLYDPQKVIDTIVRLATEPEDEVIVGVAGKVAAAAHSIAPGLNENLMGKQTHKTQMEDAPLAEFSPGSVREPMATGTEVTGGRLQQK
ncbi:MAG TPA: SDR family oxidoreductase [Pirellulales bacterium]|jgi:short-subunit dehydrogenase|nr:SDR family oxidoreductase [Pirellulales bacterium]